MKENIGQDWEDLLPHVEDSIRNGDFEMGKPELAISDADIAYVWGALQAVPSYCERYKPTTPLVVLMEDDLRHTSDTPFCPDADCPCHSDAAYFDEFIARPVREGRLKTWEAQELLWPER